MKKRFLLSAGILLALLASLLAPVAVAATPGNGEAVRLIVTFDVPVNQAAQDYVTDKGGQVLNTFEIVPGMVVLLPGQAIQGLSGLRGVREVGIDGRISAIDTELDNSWGVKHIGAGTVHAYNQGAGIAVAVLDSGVDYTHPDLDANYAGGYDFVNNDNNPLDDNGHGTHVSGTIAAEDDNNGVVGVAPGASIYALKILDASGSGYWSDFIRALEWSVNNGIQVVNMSLGASRDAPGVRDVVKAAYDAGIVLVAAAGNSGNPGGKGNSVEYPGRYDEVIAVAAVDQANTRASFSSTGDQVELAAPGVQVNSTLPGGGYGPGSGTSMASPHVAGVAVLVLANGTLSDLNSDGAINNQDVRLVLQQTADDLGASGKDAQYGYGLVDADEAAPPSGGNRAPVANAGNNQSVTTGATVQLDGTGSYDPDGDAITYSWALVSIPAGSAATLSGGASATPTFVADVDGTYEVSLTVSDGELSVTDSVVVTAATVSQATTVSVSSISYATEGGKNLDKHLNVTIALQDNLGNPVAGASVSIVLNNTTTGQSWSGSATTGAGGTVTFGLKNALSGTYTTSVTDVTATGLTWDGVTPANGFTK